ncbi:MAG: circularly permuted type 2 ATP-grasp protein [Myxococcota bacterium]
MFEDSGQPRPSCAALADRIRHFSPEELMRRQALAESAMMDLGITFNVYGHSQGTEKIFPFDILPRVVSAEDWARLERGLQQRIEALNLFVADLYGAQKILDDGVVPRELVESSAAFLEPCRGIVPPRGVWIHVTGTDLVRDGDGEWYVLEDNLRCPSGVSYLLQNRALMKRTFPRMFEAAGVRPVSTYPSRLLATLQAMSSATDPVVVVLTPGVYNSAYFEHSFLAQQMGVELVEGRDLVVDDGFVKMRTTNGLERVDVIYRRIDDVFIDPKVFRPDSVLGIPGIMDVYRAGRVALANAPGPGVADDKVIYAFTPDIIQYYLDQDPIIPIVPTYLCRREKDLAYVLDHLPELVVKAANESGGYGMLVGPKASREQIEEFRGRIQSNPRNYIAQPTLKLSRVPTLIDGQIEGRHVDLRPYVLYGEKVEVIPGGLTRVALPKGSLVVNSSQGGGSKDTWVLAGEEKTAC